MVKATINFDDELYRRLIKETVERYGKMRGFSKLVNEKIRKAEGVEMKPIKSKLGETKRVSIAKETFGIWKMKETGAEYIRKLRNESERRLKKMGL